MDTRTELMRFDRQTPFKPFLIKLSDGRSFALNRPRMFGLGLTTVLVCSETALLAQVPLTDVLAIEALEPAA